MKKEFFVAVVIAVVVCLTFAFAGCEGAAGDNNTSPEGDASVNNGEDANGVLEAGLIVATAPNDPNGQPFVGDFKFNDEVVCTNVSVCKFEATGSVKIEFTHPLALFLNKYASANPDEDAQVVWDKPGDWGLAPQGMYIDEDGQDHTVKTIVENVAGENQILLQEDGGTIGAVDGQKFSWETENIKYVDGTISNDLSIVSYLHEVVWSGKKFDRTLTRVE